jgi:DNA-binding IclR family transcriptional regulator
MGMSVAADHEGHARGAAPQTAVGVLDRAIAILDAVERGTHTFSGLVRATGFSRTTTHRLVKALEAHGLLEPDGKRGYRLGARLLRLSAAAARELPLRELAHPVLERLAATSGEGAQLYMRSGDARLCIDSVESTSELRTIVPVGAALPLTAGSAGKVFLAHLEEQDRVRLMEGYRPSTSEGPSEARLLAELETIRRRGWASSSGERESGVASVSAPVLARDGRLVAVVSLSGPSSRLGHTRARHAAPAVLEAARDIEVAEGGGR